MRFEIVVLNFPIFRIVIDLKNQSRRIKELEAIIQGEGIMSMEDYKKSQESMAQGETGA